MYSFFLCYQRDLSISASLTIAPQPGLFPKKVAQKWHN
jgi:hypothetical protein